MSNDNNKKDINSKIDDILNEVRQQHIQNDAEKSESTKAEQPKPEQTKKVEPTEPEQTEKVEPTEPEEEEFVDISAGFTAQQPQQLQAEKPDKKAEKKKKKAEKQAAKQAEKAATAQQPAAAVAIDDNSEQATDVSQANNSTPDSEADKIISEIPALINADTTQQAVISAEPNKSAETKKSKKGFVLGGVAAVLVLLACSFFAAMALTPESIPVAAPIPEVKGATQTNENEFVFAKGVSISGIDIGGKNQKEAKALIKLKESDFKEEFTLNVNYGDGKKLSFTQDDFTYTFNTDEVFEQAVQYSRDVNTAINNGTIDQLAVPDKYNVTADAENGTVDFAVSCIVSDSSIEKVVNRSAAKIDKKAVEPHAEKYDPYAKSFEKMFKWVKGSNGTVINQEALTEDIKELFKNGAKSGDVTVETTTEKPKHKMDEVKNNVQLIGQFSTVSTNGYNANANMATALAAIDGTIVDPGKIFSFNECTGDSNLPENGYLPASVIMNEQYVPGIGGGICQAATTIYNAMLLSDMGVEERANHFYTSVYVYGGLDATIDYPNLDLKMKNNTDYQIFVHTWMDGVTLNCEIYGFQPSEWDEIRTESECSWIGSESFGFEADRVYYKKGKEVKREDLPDSVYSLKNGHYVVAGDPGNVSNKIEDPKKNLKIS
ncbi:MULTISPECIES: VanW family protein [unclassified Ruminococcus]|uniref:VanW family protein n=1 Tax=unclassified Ruminococcus TaxID=2608920 RepID=UPI00210A452A|nr:MULTISPECIES: VanW family protein [unclassified Ruminococcus]MCQ4022206.1 hypothetical protein [Ruminococcus sp. zg-924]MCQ4115231.1 hypothetical protein [Ruminococcus sp. zg-921]